MSSTPRRLTRPRAWRSATPTARRRLRSAGVRESAEAGEAEARDIEDAVAIEGVVEIEGGAAVEVTLGAARIQHAARERGRARELFEQLATLQAGDPERPRI